MAFMDFAQMILPVGHETLREQVLERRTPMNQMMNDSPRKYGYEEQSSPRCLHNAAQRSG